MFALFKCYLSIAVYFVIFYIYGYTFLKLIKRTYSMCEAVLSGFFIYFSFFQLYFLVGSFLYFRFDVFSVGWFAIQFMCSILLFLKMKKKIIRSIVETYLFIKDWIIGHPIIAFVSFAIILFSYVRIVTRPLVAPDPSTYIGNMNLMLYRNRLFIAGYAIDPKEIMRGYYYQFASLSYIIGVKPIAVCFYVARTVGFISANLVSYLLGKVIFSDNHVKIIYFLTAFQIICYIWFSAYCTDFYTRRIYEAKGYCQYIVCPFMVYFWIILNQKKKVCDISAWALMFLCAVASIPISASTLMVTPVSVLFGFVATFSANYKEMEIKDKIRLLGYSILSALPNLAYILYFAATSKGFISLYPLVLF